MGHAWYVDEGVRAATPDEEIALLGSIDLKSQAVIGPDFAQVEVPQAAEGDSYINLTCYAPNELRYEYSTTNDKMVVFSEIYYPRGWKATLEDGTPVDLLRANWTLRAAVLPAGEHTLTMRFEPESYRLSTRVSRASSISLLLLLLLAAGGAVVWGRKEDGSVV